MNLRPAATYARLFYVLHVILVFVATRNKLRLIALIFYEIAGNFSYFLKCLVIHNKFELISSQVFKILLKRSRMMSCRRYETLRSLQCEPMWLLNFHLYVSSGYSGIWIMTNEWRKNNNFKGFFICTRNLHFSNFYSSILRVSNSKWSQSFRTILPSFNHMKKLNLIKPRWSFIFYSFTSYAYKLNGIEGQRWRVRWGKRIWWGAGNVKMKL